MTATQYTLVTTFLVVVASTAYAGPDDNQAWSAIAVNGSIDDDSRFLLWFDAHARFRDDAGELGTTIIRPGIGWKATKGLNLWLGYARVTSHRDGPDVEEDRLWQQATYPVASWLGGSLSGRTRLEQRRRSSAGDKTGWRLRQAWRWSRPIEGSTMSYVVSNETFFGLNDADWGQRDGYDQNRAFLGLAWQAKQKLRAEIGYLNNHIDGGTTGSRTNHVLSLALYVRL